MIYELPPQVTGTKELIELRDYLVRLAKELERAGNTDMIITDVVNKATAQAQKQTSKAIQDQSQNLKALIIKNANEITAYADSIETELHSSYVAISDYGNYYEQIDTKVQQTAKETLESYEYKEGVSLINGVQGLDAYMTELNGQIRKGVIEDPETHEMHIGIAISEQLTFNGTWTDPNTGVVYDKLAGDQTLGLYTSLGWQFWIGGQKMGWFNAQDSMLHVANIIVENKLLAGADWEISVTGGFGLRYIGEVT